MSIQQPSPQQPISALDLIQFDGITSVPSNMNRNDDASEQKTVGDVSGSEFVVVKESESVSISTITPILLAKATTSPAAEIVATAAAAATAVTSANATSVPHVAEVDATVTTTTDSERNLAQMNSKSLLNAASGEFLLSDVSTITHIKETVRKYTVADELHEVPLAEEEDDHLSPLMMDNHTVLEHQELFKPITRLIDVVDRVHEIPEFKPYQPYMITNSTTTMTTTAATVAPTTPPLLRNCDKKDSIGSMDSESSMSSFERQTSLEDSSTQTLQRYGYSSSSDAAASSDENAKDSGCDVTGETKNEDDEDAFPIEIPDEDMSEKIVQQVEFYFSNENILKDAFLLKHVRRNKEGFVSLKLISSFKRVRQLTKDWRVVGYAIKLKSINVEVNDIGTKVRRLEPLPVFDETMPSRTVVATDLPFEKLTIEKVSDLFSKCGEIALIRILRPGGSIPADVRQFYNKHPDLHERECALVEFTESQSARLAQLMEGMQTYEMVAPKKKTGKKAATVSKIIENYKYTNYSDAERSRGGEGPGGDYKFNHNFRRSSSGYYMKHDSPPQQQQQQQQQQQHQQHVCQHHRKPSFGNVVPINNNENCEHYNRRSSNCSVGNGTDTTRKYSNCSEGYSSCTGGSDSRRQSACSADSSRRSSNCSAEVPFRRASNCSDFCPCSRRASNQCNDTVRRVSQCSEHNRRFSNGNNVNYERRSSIPAIGDIGRRVSFDNEQYNDRKISIGSFGGNNGFETHHRKISSGFDQIRKISGNDKFYDGRKMSSDSGYDRRSSIGSMASDYVGSPRTSRNNSVIMQTITQMPAGPTKAESLVRTPIGPDGSKGFSSRARKLGQVIGPV